MAFAGRGRRRTDLLVALVLALLLWALFRRFTVDDAFIAYRHAANLARGYGPVMNPGERVEGVSNLPWTLLLGIVAALGVPPHLAGPVLSVLAALGCVPVAALLAARLGGGGRAGGVAALATAAGMPLAVWGASGMETAAEALLLLGLGLELHRGRRFRSGLLLGGLAALRPEGLAFALPTALVEARRGAGGRRHLRILWGLAVVLVPLLLGRLLYYGDWLPNPARAKAPDGLASLAPGLLYAARFVATFPLAIAALASLPRTQRHSPAAIFLAGAVAVQLGFAAAAGGDRFPGFRFLAPVWPLCGVALGLGFEARIALRRGTALLVAIAIVGLACVLRPNLLLPAAEILAGLARLELPPASHVSRLLLEVRHVGVVLVGVAGYGLVTQRSPRALGARAALLVAALLGPAGFDPELGACREPDAAARFGRPVGMWLRAHLPPGSLVATNAAGSLPYWADLPVVDMLGLTDRHIARTRPDVQRWVGHERGDAAYVLGRRPAVVILGGPEGSLEPWPFPGDRALAASPEFRRLYAPERVGLAGFDLTFYRRRDPEPPPPDGGR